MPSISQDPTRRTQVLQRQTTDLTGIRDVAGAGKGAQAFADFFGDQREVMEAQDEAAAMQADDEALLQLDMAAKADPVAAREAMRTGDLTGYMGVERAARQKVVTAAPTILGRAVGLRDSQSFRLSALDLDPTQDLDQYTADYIGERTKGMNVRGAAAYQAQIESEVPRIQTKRTKALADHTRMKTLGNVAQIVESALDTDGLTNVDSVNRLLRQGAASMTGTPYLEARAVLQQSVDQHLLKLMATTENDAVRMKLNRILNEPNDAVDGLSTMQRQAKNVDTWQAEAVRAQQGSRTAALDSFMNSFDTRMRNVASGSLDDSLPGIAGDLTAAMGNWTSDDHPQVLKAMNALHKAALKAKEDGNVYQAWLSGNRFMSTEQRKDLIDPRVGSINDIDPETLAMIAETGATTKVKQMFTSGMKASDPDTLLKTANVISSLMHNPKSVADGLDAFLGDDTSKALYTASIGANKADFEALLPGLQDRLKNYQGSVRGYYGDRLRAQGQDDATSVTGRGAVTGENGYQVFFSTMMDEKGEDEEAREWGEELSGVTAVTRISEQLGRYLSLLR